MTRPYSHDHVTRAGPKEPDNARRCSVGENGMTTFEGRLGRVLFALGFIALGVESLLLATPVMRLELWPKTYPDTAPVAYASGLVVLTAGVAILVPRLGAGIIAIVTLVWTLTLHLPHLLQTITHGDYWSGTAECFAVFSAAWVLSARAAPGFLDRIAALGIPYGRICFGLSLLVFGAMHFIYHDFTASFIPAWIPFRPFLAIATGVAHCAAGLAILSGVLGRLAATLAGIMYGSWVLILHIPRALLHIPADAAVNPPFEWNGVFVATILCGGALAVAESFARKP
jgi:uncharacterized membrane protein YphA (DoxX/SURF4 family)